MKFANNLHKQSGEGWQNNNNATMCFRRNGSICNYKSKLVYSARNDAQKNQN